MATLYVTTVRRLNEKNFGIYLYNIIYQCLLTAVYGSNMIKKGFFVPLA